MSVRQLRLHLKEVVIRHARLYGSILGTHFLNFLFAAFIYLLNLIIITENHKGI